MGEIRSRESGIIWILFISALAGLKSETFTELVAYNICSICFRYVTILVKHDCIISICIIPFYLHQLNTISRHGYQSKCSTNRIKPPTLALPECYLRRQISIYPFDLPDHAKTRNMNIVEFKHNTKISTSQYLCKYVVEEVIVVNL